MISKRKAAALAKARKKKAEALARYKRRVTSVTRQNDDDHDPFHNLSREELIQNISTTAEMFYNLSSNNSTFYNLPSSATNSVYHDSTGWSITSASSDSFWTTDPIGPYGYHRVSSSRYGWSLLDTAVSGGTITTIIESSPHIWRKMSPEDRARHEAAARKRQEEKEKAEATAELLLLRHLTPEQQEEYRQHKYFHVEVGGRRYRIDKGWAGNVKLVEEGKVAESLCIHPSIRVPDQDNMLAQKLLLECDEDQFRRIANITRIAGERYRRDVAGEHARLTG